ncbi:MAG TPA: aconitase/3-isopropylmalate dehydratase large subunit family protein [Bordetella sp.]|nr:aconitase/3-isopropylmalate dehydratase large subunit family protein [Bordetella sp.]
MAMSLAQKILARASGRSFVEEGEIIWAKPDLITVPEVSFPAYVKRLRDIGITSFAHPERIVVAIDHEVPVHSTAGAERNRLTRQLAVSTQVGHFYDGIGITHPLVVEQGLISPGMFVVGADTHTSAIGGTGALAIPFGMEVTMPMARGDIWIRVPGTVRVRVSGTLPAGVGARDIVLAALKQIDEETASYNVIEYTGDTIPGLSIPERMTIAGLSIDCGAEAGIVPADAMAAQALQARGVHNAMAMAGDDDAPVHKEIYIDAATLAPQVSIPPSPAHVRDVTELETVRIDHAYIGSCASGTLAELQAAARLLAGRRVHPDVQLLIIPATRKIHEQAMQDGTLNTLMRAGAQLAPSTCGPCFGGLAQLNAGETRISTSTRNDRGRMGSVDANIYLASALTVAASALTGHITDVRSLLQE